MATEQEAGAVTLQQAMLLLLLDTPAELKRLERESAFVPMAPGR